MFRIITKKLKRTKDNFYFSVIEINGKNIKQLQFMCEFHVGLFFFFISIFLTLFFQEKWWFWWSLTFPFISYSGARAWGIYGVVMAKLRINNPQ